MEKLEKIKRTKNEFKHLFYCDRCKRYLGESFEHDDGWYECIGEFEVSFYLDRWYRYKKCLCNLCQIKFKNQMGLLL